MTVGCGTNCGRSMFDVVLRFTRQSTAERHVNRSASTDGEVKKVMKLQPKVKILELTLGRYHFTSHGLHLNFKGKKVVSQNLALVVQQFCNKNIPPNSIPVHWKDPPLDDTIIEVQDTNATEKVKNQTLSPYQRRNCPAQRNPDFLWM